MCSRRKANIKRANSFCVSTGTENGKCSWKIVWVIDSLNKNNNLFMHRKCSSHLRNRNKWMCSIHVSGVFVISAINTFYAILMVFASPISLQFIIYTFIIIRRRAISVCILFPVRNQYLVCDTISFLRSSRRKKEEKRKLCKYKKFLFSPFFPRTPHNL